MPAHDRESRMQENVHQYYKLSAVVGDTTCGIALDRPQGGDDESDSVKMTTYTTRRRTKIPWLKKTVSPTCSCPELLPDKEPLAWGCCYGFVGQCVNPYLHIAEW